MAKTDDKYIGVVLENIQDKVQRLAEAMADVPAHVRSIDERLTVVEQDVKVIKAVVTDQSGELRQLDERVIGLEQAA